MLQTQAEEVVAFNLEAVDKLIGIALNRMNVFETALV